MTETQQIAITIRRASQMIERAASIQVAQLGMTYRQVLVLVTVKRSPECSQKAITEATGIDRTTVNIIVERLAKDGLLKYRRQKGDKRTTSITCTEEGESRASKSMEVLSHFNDSLRGILRSNSIVVERALNTLIQSLGEKAEVVSDDEKRAERPKARIRTTATGRARVRA